MTHKRSTMADPTPSDHAYLQIGEVAERTSVTQRTLRFYEEKGLLTPPSRLDGGFRLYSEHDVRQVEQIKRLQNLLGLALADIKEMVEAEAVKSQIRAEYRRDADLSERKAKLSKAIAVTERQVAIIDHKLAALREMKSDLEQKITTVQGWLLTLEERSAVELGV